MLTVHCYIEKDKTGPFSKLRQFEASIFEASNVQHTIYPFGVSDYLQVAFQRG